jgi:acetyl esterase/lipase
LIKVKIIYEEMESLLRRTESNIMKSNFTALLITILFIFSSSIIKSQIKIDSSTIYIHSENTSFTAKVIKSAFYLYGKKRGSKEIKHANQKTSTEVATSVPRSIQKNYLVQESVVNNKKVWTIKPKENASDQVVLYLHGGTYLFTVKKYHWIFVKELLLRTNATIVLPDYPLAPSSTCEAALEFIGQVYQEILLKHSPKNIILTGDSSGGGLALGFALNLRKENKAQPSQIILLCPWLDITMSNKDILEVDEKDKVLGIESLRIAGKVFAGNLDFKDYRISPIYGDFSGLGKISVFIGTHDILVADCRKLKRLTKASNISINYFEYPEMFHDWFFVKTMKEAKVALSQLSSLILNTAAA